MEPVGRRSGLKASERLDEANSVEKLAQVSFAPIPWGTSPLTSSEIVNPGSF
jgi:hypothetical protein